MTGENYRKFKFQCLFLYCNCFHVSVVALSGYSRELRSSTPELFIICPFIESSLLSCLGRPQQILVHGPSLDFCVSEAYLCLLTTVSSVLYFILLFYIFEVPAQKPMSLIPHSRRWIAIIYHESCALSNGEEE